jgi:hypothetical protein
MFHDKKTQCRGIADPRGKTYNIKQLKDEMLKCKKRKQIPWGETRAGQTAF